MENQSHLPPSRRVPYCCTVGDVSRSECDIIHEIIRQRTEDDEHSSSESASDESYHSVSEEDEKWDCIVLTAMNDQQKRIFELQLEDIPWRDYALKCVVVQDPPGVKAGSGGATVWMLKENRKHKYFETNAKVLLIHSGGYSQRTPHLSNVGKVFMTTPDGKSFLEGKLEMLRRILPAIRAGIFIAASDVSERISIGIHPIDDDTDFLLLMHRSSIQVALNHGVYIVDGAGVLERVLQKPSREEMKEQGALNMEKDSSDPWCYTDSSYFISSRATTKLLDYAGNIPILTEICAYGDFLKPLGSKAEMVALADSSSGLDEATVAALNRWRVSLNACFHEAKTELLDCGFDSFAHYGSVNEFLEHFQTVQGHRRIPIHSTWGHQVGPETILEYCNLPDYPLTFVGNRSIVSCVYAGARESKNGAFMIPDNVIVYSTPVEKNDVKGWVTVVIGTSDDVKKTFRQNKVLWGGTKIKDYEGTSLWEAPLFTMTPGAEKSAVQSIRKYIHRETDPEILSCCGWSMADVVRYVDAEKLVEYRKQRKQLWWHRGPESLGEPPLEEDLNQPCTSTAR